MAGHDPVPAAWEETDNEGTGTSRTSSRSKSEPSYGIAFATASVMGIAFGFFFEKSHVYEPEAIRDQFVFQRWIMMKMFMGAVAASCLSFVLLERLSPERFQQVRFGFHPCTRGFWTGGMLGGALLGIGMAIAGACPGMVLPQVGTELPNALLTVLGGLLGALTFGLLEGMVRPAVLDKGTQCADTDHAFVDIRMGKPFALLSAALGLACGGFAIALELLFPFEEELGLGSGGAHLDRFLGLGAKAWPPALAGALLGALQLPAACLLRDSLGSSTSYECVASGWLACVPAARKKFDHLERTRTGGVGSWWQVFYAGFAILGAFLSAQASNTFPTVARGVDAPSALTGGFLMLFGSRLGGGCTSGHGISGMPLLHSLSMVAVCSMFGAAIATGFILQAFGIYAL